MNVESPQERESTPPIFNRNEETNDWGPPYDGDYVSPMDVYVRIGKVLNEVKKNHVKSKKLAAEVDSLKTLVVKIVYMMEENSTVINSPYLNCSPTQPTTTRLFFPINPIFLPPNNPHHPSSTNSRASSVEGAHHVDNPPVPAVELEKFSDDILIIALNKLTLTNLSLICNDHSTGAGGARRWLTSDLMECVNSTFGVGRRDKINPLMFAFVQCRL